MGRKQRPQLRRRGFQGHGIGIRRHRRRAQPGDGTRFQQLVPDRARRDICSLVLVVRMAQKDVLGQRRLRMEQSLRIALTYRAPQSVLLGHVSLVMLVHVRRRMYMRIAHEPYMRVFSATICRIALRPYAGSHCEHMQDRIATICRSSQKPYAEFHHYSDILHIPTQ